jgi:hypothetical protein
MGWSSRFSLFFGIADAVAAAVSSASDSDGEMSPSKQPTFHIGSFWDYVKFKATD